MNSRQRVLTAMYRQEPDRVPVDLSWGLTPALLERFKAITGAANPDDYFDLDVRFVSAELAKGWGSIGTQTTLPFGTPQDIKEEVRRRIETIGAGGGLLLGPTHALEPDVPWENILAFFEAVRQYGIY